MKVLFLLIAFALIPITFSDVTAMCTTEYIEENGNCVDEKGTLVDGVGSPFTQLERDVAPEDVVCVGDRELFFKSSNGNPVCLFPESVSTLIERGFI